MAGELDNFRITHVLLGAQTELFTRFRVNCLTSIPQHFMPDGKTRGLLLLLMLPPAAPPVGPLLGSPSLRSMMR